jgi:hypothetical protein
MTYVLRLNRSIITALDNMDIDIQIYDPVLFVTCYCTTEISPRFFSAPSTIPCRIMPLNTEKEEMVRDLQVRRVCLLHSCISTVVIMSPLVGRHRTNL